MKIFLCFLLCFCFIFNSIVFGMDDSKIEENFEKVRNGGKIMSAAKIIYLLSVPSVFISPYLSAGLGIIAFFVDWVGVGKLASVETPQAKREKGEEYVPRFRSPYKD